MQSDFSQDPPRGYLARSLPGLPISGTPLIFHSTTCVLRMKHADHGFESVPLGTISSGDHILAMDLRPPGSSSPETCVVEILSVDFPLIQSATQSQQGLVQ